MTSQKRETPAKGRNPYISKSFTGQSGDESIVTSCEFLGGGRKLVRLFRSIFVVRMMLAYTV